MSKIFGICHAFTLLTTLTSFKSNRIFFFLNWSVILVSIGVMPLSLLDPTRRQENSH